MTEKLQVGLSIANVVLIAISAYLIWSRIRKHHDWNRRKATHDFITQVVFGSVSDIRATLETKIDPYDDAQDYSTIGDRLTDDEQRLLRNLLNYLEMMCLGIKHGIFDDDIAYDCACVVLRIYARWAKPYIDSAQEDLRFPFNWIEVQVRSQAWSKRLQEDRERHINTVRRPGKPKL